MVVLFWREKESERKFCGVWCEEYIGRGSKMEGAHFLLFSFSVFIYFL